MYLKSLNIGGKDYLIETHIVGEEDPTSETEGNLGQFYYNSNTGIFWKCTYSENGVYSWEEFSTTAFDEVTMDEETRLLHFLKNGEDVVDPVYIVGGGGGGGGGSGNNAILTVTNMTGWLTHTISTGADCTLSIDWSSLENETETGAGILTIRVNNVVKRTLDISQGIVRINIKDILATGSNKVKLTVTDVYENTKSINFTIKSVDLRLASSFSTVSEFTAGQQIVFTYTPYGSVSKTTHFEVDGDEVGTQVVAASGRQQSYSLPAMAHGAHSLKVWFTAEIDGEEVSSNILYFDMVVVGESTAPIIATSFRESVAVQYETLYIRYRVYTPNSLTSAVSLYAGNTKITDLTVDRTEQTWNYRCDGYGELNLSIRSGTAIVNFVVDVEKSDIDVEPEEDSLALRLSSQGRSNNEEHPEIWADTEHNISCQLTGFNFVSNGWAADKDGNTVLRVSGDARVTIPYKPFAKDFRTTGKTLEFEFATRDVLDYDAVLVSCMSGNRGFQLTSQRATLRSERSEISTQYKEDEHVRISFVAEKRSENRLLYVYINGIMSGVVEYPDDDDFSQQTPVNITIGANTCTTDIYCIRVYDNNLTRFQIVGNWIADTQNIADMLARHAHNDVYDEYGKVIISKLPKDLPYMILEAAELPQYKGDKKTVSVEYVDPVTPARSFTASGCQANVQGTSSAPYARKNYDLQFKGGFTLAGDTPADNYELAPGIIPFNRFVLKADVASSESANNVELVKLFCDVDPYKRPEELANAKVRKGIYGFPIVLFWRNPDGEETLMGKYNFNLPKRAPEPYGYSGDMESWEFQNNTSNLMLFLTDYFSEAPQADPSTGDVKAAWRYDYEARFPSDEWVDYSKLQEFQSFVFSTYRAGATGADLETPVTYTETHTVYDEVEDPETGAISYVERLVTEDVIYTKDTAEYRLSRFHHEFEKYAEVDSFIFYYIFTELFLMVDSRAKNLFIGFSGGPTTGLAHLDRKAVAEPYDMDTAIGTNNEGSLVFDYGLEDTDHLEGGADVFNGQNSVLWCNLRDAFGAEIARMYQSLRSAGVLSYAAVSARFTDHQAKWPEAIFNDDAQFKYLDPLVNPDPGKEPTDVYLPMLQGSKAEQRKWWLYNRFRYMDSKWNAGDALTDVIQLRGYAKADITVTPYADIYPTIKYGSVPVQARGKHGVPQTLACPLDNVNDTEIYIYSASQLASVGDLSGLKVGFADFSKATKLQSIKVGSDAAGYTNGNLTGLSVGTNPLLGSVDARNCTALSGTVDLSGAANIEHVYLEGSAVTGVSVPNGGILKTLHLPGTVTNLTIRNQTGLTDFSMAGYAKVSTLRIEKTPNIPIADILLGAEAVNRIRIIDAEWTCDTAEEFEEILQILETSGGLDENGGNTDESVVTGIVRVAESVDADVLEECAEHFPELLVFANGQAVCTVRYRNYDGTLLYTQRVAYGADAADPVTAGLIETPTRPVSGSTAYLFAGWDKSGTQVTANITRTATYTESAVMTVVFKNWDESVLYTAYCAEGGTIADPVTSGAIPQPSRPGNAEAVYRYMGWDSSLINITQNKVIHARYSAEASITVTFVNTDGTELYVMYVASGASVPNPVIAGLIPAPTRESDASYIYEWSGWSGTMTNITQDTTITATYTSYQYYTATFNNYDGTLLLAQKVKKNGSVTEPVAAGMIETPARAPGEGEEFHYIYKGWDKALSTNMTANVTYTAQFKTDQTFTVTFVNYDGTTVLDTQAVLDEEGAVDPVSSGRIATPVRPSTAQYDYTYKGWDKSFAKITADTTITATYTNTTRQYTVRFWDGTTLLDTVVVNYNATAKCSVTPQKSGVSDPENYVLLGWDPVNTSIKADTDCYAEWEQMTITDTWAQIFAAEADGTYTSKYSVGDTKAFVLGESETVVMQIAAMGDNADPLADGSGKAKIAWVSKYLLEDNHRMNPSKTAGTEGTGALGGWEKSEMRTYLRETILPDIPAVIRDAIKEVTKYTKIYNASEAAVNNSASTDTVWIPSGREVFGGSSYETTGVVYTGLLSSATLRKKSKLGSASASSWWTRSAYSAYNFISVATSGGTNNYSANYSYGVALGFCT